MPRPTHDAKLPGYDEALCRVLDRVTPLEPEAVALPEAAGRVLRAGVAADRDLPPFHRSAMDGYAVCVDGYRAHEAYRVIGDVAAGQPAALGVSEVDRSRDTARIATGAAVPEPFDAVVPIEQSTPLDGNRVRFDQARVAAGQAIHPRAADAQAGEELIRPGTLLGSAHLGIAAAAGATTLRVGRRPRVVILSSGDEVRPFDTATAELSPGQIRNSNGPMLTALLPRLGGHVVRHEHVCDEADATRTAAARALEDADLIVTTGGVSVGARDLFPDLWPALGFEDVLHGVALQPGRPLLIAKHPETGARVAGLPGNPVSVLVTAMIFVGPLLRAMLGRSPALPWRRVWLGEPVQPNARREAFRFARLIGDTAEQVEVLPWQGSGDLVHTATADGLVRLPVQAGTLEPGTPLRFLATPG